MITTEIQSASFHVCLIGHLHNSRPFNLWNKCVKTTKAGRPVLDWSWNKKFFFVVLKSLTFMCVKRL